MSGFRFRLVLADGSPAGEFVTAVPDWKAGQKFLTGDGRRLRIVAVEPEPPGAHRSAAAFLLASSLVLSTLESL